MYIKYTKLQALRLPWTPRTLRPLLPFTQTLSGHHYLILYVESDSWTVSKWAQYCKGVPYLKQLPCSYLGHQRNKPPVQWLEVYSSGHHRFFESTDERSKSRSPVRFVPPVTVGLFQRLLEVYFCGHWRFIHAITRGFFLRWLEVYSSGGPARLLRKRMIPTCFKLRFLKYVHFILP